MPGVETAGQCRAGLDRGPTLRPFGGQALRRFDGMHSRTLILIGFIFSMLGFLLPLLIVIHVLPSTLFLNFFAAGDMVVGLALGIIGASQYVGRHRK